MTNQMDKLVAQLADAGYTLVTPTDGAVVVRTARKSHHCTGGHDGTQHIPCAEPILTGSLYIEHLGECGPYSTGERYHLACAAQQGLLINA